MTMAKIIDEGKVWLKGMTRPLHAIKVDEKYFVVKKKDEETLEKWIDGNRLCIDLHNREKKLRTGRYFPISLKGNIEAALFSGFEKTKHKAVKVVIPEEEVTNTYILEGKDYSKFNAEKLDSQSFWRLTGF